MRQELTGFLRLVRSYGRLWTEPLSVQERAEIECALEDQTALQPSP